MRTYYADWKSLEDYRAEWRASAERNRLARLASPDPERYLPGDVAWVVSVIRRVVGWFAEGFGAREASSAPYPVQRRQRTGA